MAKKLNSDYLKSRQGSAFHRWLLFCSLICLLGAFGMPVQEIQVVCFGDSITYGAKVDGKSWVEYLKNGHHKGYQFINAGRSGRKTSDKKELLPVLTAHQQAGIFAIFLGVNDLKNGNDSMVDSCVNNMTWIIRTIKAQDPTARILLLSPSDINTQTMSQLNKDKRYNENTRTSLRHLEKAYHVLALKEHISFLSLLHAVPKDAYADGLHPNAKGQQHLSMAIWQALKKIK